VASDVLPRLICAIDGEIHTEAQIEVVGNSSVSDVLLRSNFRFLCLGVEFPDRHSGLMEPPDSIKGLHDKMDSVAVRQDGSFQICRTCRTSLLKCDMPRRAIANGMEFGVIPAELRDMSICEQLLVSRVRFKVNILKLMYEPLEGKDPSERRRRKTPPQRGIKGHAFGFPHVGFTLDSLFLLIRRTSAQFSTVYLDQLLIWRMNLP